MNQAFHLYRLQQIDTQIDQAEADIAELDRLLEGDDTVRQAQAAKEEAEKALHQAQNDLKQAEFAVKEQQNKIAQSESSLYGGRIRNPKELQDLQKEIASLKKYLAQLEDRQLEAMLALEEAENVNQARQADFARAQAAFSEHSAGWLGQRDQRVHTLERLRAERAAAAAPVSADAQKVYDQLRRRKSGIAVTTVKDGSCAVCGATIRPSELQTARTAQDLVYCSSCGRIFYAG